MPWGDPPDDIKRERERCGGALRNGYKTVSEVRKRSVRSGAFVCVRVKYAVNAAI